MIKVITWQFKPPKERKHLFYPPKQATIPLRPCSSNFHYTKQKIGKVSLADFLLYFILCAKGQNSAERRGNFAFIALREILLRRIHAYVLLQFSKEQAVRRRQLFLPQGVQQLLRVQEVRIRRRVFFRNRQRRLQALTKILVLIIGKEDIYFDGRFPIPSHIFPSPHKAHRNHRQASQHRTDKQPLPSRHTTPHRNFHLLLSFPAGRYFILRFRNPDKYLRWCNEFFPWAASTLSTSPSDTILAASNRFPATLFRPFANTCSR